MKTLVLLGGYGETGRELAPLLLRETDARLVVAGRNMEKASALAERLDATFQGRVTSTHADADRPEGLAEVLRNAAMLVDLTNASRRTPELARAALAAGADFLDIHYQGELPRLLASVGREFHKAGRLLVTQGGCHPGLPGLMARAAAAKLDGLTEVAVGMGLSCRLERAAALELVDAMQEEEGEVYCDGAWRIATSKDVMKMDLGPRFGMRTCYPMRMEEMRAIPERHGVSRAGVYVAGFNPLADFFAIPLAVFCGKAGLRWPRAPLATLLRWCVNVLASPPAISFALEAHGRLGGRQARLRLVIDSDSPYGLTAAPVAAFLRQYLAGAELGTGMQLMALAAEPNALLADLERMGARVSWEYPDV